jgi:hypothetical protein
MRGSPDYHPCTSMKTAAMTIAKSATPVQMSNASRLWRGSNATGLDPVWWTPGYAAS